MEIEWTWDREGVAEKGQGGTDFVRDPLVIQYLMAISPVVMAWRVLSRISRSHFSSLSLSLSLSSVLALLPPGSSRLLE